METPILTSLNDSGVLTITFNRPEKKNAFNQAQWLALRDALDDARTNDDVIVTILTGAGDDFTSGQDLSDFGGDPDAPQPFELFMDALCKFDKPLLAAVKGYGIGIGITILFHCDIVYVGESARFRMPFASLGLVTEAAASYLLQEVVGPQLAAELLFTAEWIDADLALELGIARQIFPDDEVLLQAQKKAIQIARWPLSSLREIKRLLKLAHEKSIKTAHIEEIKGMKKLVGSPENIEAVTAFLEKRTPDFKKL